MLWHKTSRATSKKKVCHLIQPLASRIKWAASHHRNHSLQQVTLLSCNRISSTSKPCKCHRFSKSNQWLFRSRFINLNSTTSSNQEWTTEKVFSKAILKMLKWKIFKFRGKTNEYNLAKKSYWKYFIYLT